MNIKPLVLSALVVAGTFSATPAFADDDHAELVAQQAAKVSVKQAQAIAIQAVGGGVVVEVDFDTSFKYKGGYYEVEVQKDLVKYDVKIDATTGKVIKKKIDN